MPKDLSKEKLLLISAAADYLGVSPDTIRRWDKSGILHSTRPDGKNRYFSLSQLKQLKLNKPLSISEAATLLEVSQATLRRLEKKGLITCEKNALGERVYSKEHLKRFLVSDYYLRKAAVQDKILRHFTQPKGISAKGNASGRGVSSVQLVKVSPIVLPNTNDIQKTLKEHEEKLASLSQAKSQALGIDVDLDKSLAFDKAPKSKLNLKNGLFLLLVVTLLSAGGLGAHKHMSQKNALSPSPQTAGINTSGQILAASSQNHRFYIDADTEVTGTTLFEENITAPNIIYSVTGGTGIAVTGGQNPIVSLDSAQVVTTLNSLPGALTIAGSGSTTVSNSGSTITISSSSTSEADTLSTVTGRGATTTTAVALNGGLTSSSATPITLSSTAPLLAIGNTGTLAITDGTNTLFSVVDQGAYGTIRLTDKASTGDPATCTAGDIYFNATDTTVKACTATNTWEALDGAASAMTSFTLSGDTGTDQTITDANILEVAGGTNGIDTVGTNTDTITLNLDTTEIGTTTFGTGSSIVWTFNSGTTDPVLTFGDNVLTIGSAATITATDVTAFNCTDCIDFDDIADSPTLDAATDINLSTLDLYVDLTSTGVFSIRDVATAFWTFDDDSTVDVVFPAAGTIGIDASTTANTTTAGVIDLNVTSLTHQNSGNNLAYVSTAAGAAATITQYGSFSTFTNTQAVTATSPTFNLYGAYNNIAKSGADVLTTDGTFNVYGSYNLAANTSTDASAAGTRRTFGGYFDATGAAAGTTTTYALYATAASADNNYGLYVNAGSTRISLDCSAGDQYVTAASTGILACGTDNDSGATIWSSIGAPTGTLSLTFDDGELNAFTVSSDTEDFWTYTAASMTTGSLIVATGPTSTGVTDHFVKLSSDVGSGGSILNLNPDFSGSAVTGYGIYQAATDATTNANTDYGVYSALALTGNAAKVGYPLYGLVTSSSTTADSLYGGYFKTSATGNVARTTNYGSISYGQTTSTTGDTVYGAYNATVSSGAINGTTRTLVGTYGISTATNATDNASTVSNVYGAIFNAVGENAGASMTGNTYGIYTTAASGDTNYGIYSSSAAASNFFTQTANTTAISTASSLYTGGVLTIQDTTSTTGAGSLVVSTLQNASTQSSNYGIYNIFTSTTGVIATSPIYQYYGIYNSVTNSGADNFTTAGTEEMYGLYLTTSNTSTDSGAAGIRRTFGVYSNVTATDGTSYSGYFGGGTYNIFASKNIYISGTNGGAGTSAFTIVDTAANRTAALIDINNTGGYLIAGATGIKSVIDTLCSAACYGNYLATSVNSFGNAAGPTYGLYNTFTNSRDYTSTTPNSVGLYNNVSVTGANMVVLATTVSYGIFNNSTLTGGNTGDPSAIALNYGIYSSTTSGTDGTTANYSLYVTSTGADAGSNYNIFSTAANSTSQFLNTATTTATTATSSLLNGGVVNIQNTTATADVSTLNVSTVNTSTSRTNIPTYGIYNTWTSSTATTTGASPINAFGIYNLLTKTGADTGAVGTTIKYYGVYSIASQTGTLTNTQQMGIGGYFEGISDQLAIVNTSYGVFARASGTDDNIGVLGIVTSTGNAVRVHTGVMGRTSSDSTTADSLYGGYFKTSATGDVARTTNYGAITYGQSSSTITADVVYGLHAYALSGAAANAATQNSYGVYSIATNGAASATATAVNAYGGIFSGVGISANVTTGTAYGVFADATGGDNNFQFYSGSAFPTISSTSGLCWDNAGASGIEDCSSAPGDLAENFGTSDSSISAGDVVELDGEAYNATGPRDESFSTKAFVKKTNEPYSKNVLGVVSTNPNLVFADDDLFSPSENPRPVSLSGRVPVKVNDENGPIAPGDLLTSSSTAGVAMKADPTKGSTIGTTLSSFAGPGQGTVIMFVATNARYNLASALQNTDLSALSFTTSTGNTIIDALGNITTAGTIQAAEGLFAVDGLGNLTSNKLTSNELIINGNASVSGDLTVNGQLSAVNGINASQISSLSSDDLTISLSGISTSTVIRFTDSMNYELFTLNQSGDATFAGTVYADNFSTANTADLAEHFPNVGDDLQAGDIAAVDPANKESIKLSNYPYQPTILGVISTAPGVSLNTSVVAGKPLALAGRVPVKVNTENGPIKAGDPITSSSVAGVGMKATNAGRIIGIALEDYSSCSDEFECSSNSHEFGFLTVFVEPGWYLGMSLAANGSFDFAKSQAFDLAETQDKSLALNQATNADGTLASSQNNQPSTMNDQQIKDLVATEVSKQLALYQQTPAPNVLGANTNVDSPIPTPTADSCPAKSQAFDPAETQAKSLALNEATASPEASSWATSGNIPCAIQEGTALAAETQSTLDKLTELLSTVNLEPSTLTVTGSTNLANVQTAGTFSQDGTFIIDYGKQLNVLGSTLYLQNDPYAGSPSCHPELVSGSGESRCAILIDIGNGKLTLNKSGTLTVPSVVATSITLAENKSAGSATIKRGKDNIFVDTAQISLKSKVIITFTNDYFPATRYFVADKIEGEGFLVKLNKVIDSDANFDWLIVNAGQLSQN